MSSTRCSARLHCLLRPHGPNSHNGFSTIDRQRRQVHSLRRQRTLCGSVGLIIQKEHNVPKEELLEFEGLVTEILPDARYRVQLDNGHQLVAYTAGRMKKNRIKTLAGDRVTVVQPF